MRVRLLSVITMSGIRAFVREATLCLSPGGSGPVAIDPRLVFHPRC